MRTPLVLLLVLALVIERNAAAEPEFPLTEDSQPHDGIPHGELIQGTYTAKEGSVFPGTERDYTIYVPARSGDIPVVASKDHGRNVVAPSPFMIFQDGVIYNAPVVFDNLIAKKQIPPLIGIFIKPGVVPAANPNALPRYNRSYEYDSVTDTYSRFLLEEFLPALEAKHGLKLSTDPNDAAIAGNSSGGICAFMAAWHRPDRIRRVFSGVGTYVGIHGADQLPVLVRKYEPKPLRIYLQSGTGDNNLYCGDWWMANQTMERALTWAGYDVNHTWGEGGHNAKHASQIFPDVLRWLWRDYATGKEIKPNPRGESKWVGYEVMSEGSDWEELKSNLLPVWQAGQSFSKIASSASGEVWVWADNQVARIDLAGQLTNLRIGEGNVDAIAAHPAGMLMLVVKSASKTEARKLKTVLLTADGSQKASAIDEAGFGMAATASGWCYAMAPDHLFRFKVGGQAKRIEWPAAMNRFWNVTPAGLALSPDQSLLYVSLFNDLHVWSFQIQPDGELEQGTSYFELQPDELGKADALSMCVDTNGWLYVATALGIQVCDQAGRVNFIIPTPQPLYGVCFGGKDLGELFIACGDKIYKRPTKAHGYISGQMAPIKPPAPKL